MKKRKPTAPGGLSSFQAFTMERRHRRDLKGAPYNPRQIDEHAKRKLRGALETLGLLSPVTVNRSGLLVAGHQRLAILDALEGHDDWSMDVAVVDLAEPQEREANVLLNNPQAQGGWDLPLLADVLATDGVDVPATGFDPFDIECMFPEDERFASMFSSAKTPATVNAALTEIEAATEQARELRAEARQRESDSVSGPAVEGPTGPREENLEDDLPEAGPVTHVEPGSAYDRSYKTRTVGGQDQTEFYAVVVFETNSQREAFMTHVGAEHDDRYVDGARVAHALGLVLP